MKKSIAILGSTGSIGTQALEVISSFPEKFSLNFITANNNAELLIQQAVKYNPDSVIIANDKKYKLVSQALSKYQIKVFAGKDAISQIVQNDYIDIVLAQQFELHVLEAIQLLHGCGCDNQHLLLG